MIGAVFAIIQLLQPSGGTDYRDTDRHRRDFVKVALCLVIGANLVSGLLAMINASGANTAGKRVSLGSLLFNLIGCALILPFVNLVAVADWLDKLPVNDEELVIFFHVFYNLIRYVAMVPFAKLMARLFRA